MFKISVDDLLPVTTGGYVLTGAQQFSAISYANGKKVSSVSFKNEGTQSIALVKFGSQAITVAPGGFIADVAPLLGHLETEYEVSFVQTSGPAAPVNKLVVLVQTYI